MGVRCQDGTSWFRMRNDERIDRGAAPRTSPEQGRASGECLGEGLRDITSLEEPVLAGVSTRVTFQTFHQDDRGNARWPEPLFAKNENESQSPLRALSEVADSARIQDQHGALSRLATRSLDELLDDGGSGSALACGRLSDLGNQLGDVLVALS
jgi:hypothetical protein